MANDKQDLKKGLSGGFIWFLIAAFVLVMTIQNFIDTKHADVSFSYQIEHLVNLDLVHPEENKKVALNDNLVTFSGRYREKLTEEGKQRYKYLSLLQENHKLRAQQESIQKELNEFKQRINDSAGLFLYLAGIQVPANGYLVVDDIYSNAENDHTVAIKTLPAKRTTLSLPQLRNSYQELTAHPSEAASERLGNELSQFVQVLRSPVIGIGNEAVKGDLREIEREVVSAQQPNTALSSRLTAYDKALKELQGVVNDLDKKEGELRLLKLRSVRDYKDALEESRKLKEELSNNEAQLERARYSVSDVIWFFNDRELSTKALEQQDPEEYNKWFLNSKSEWEKFGANREGSFKAPDQPINTVLKKTFKSEQPTPNYMSYLITFLPVIMVVLVLYFLFSRQMRGMGSNAMNFGKSPAKLMMKGQNKITFKDVAGVDEALEELQEIVDFLKNPKKFTSLGGHIPKGVLCVGPPGTGKTLIAKAVAGEADRPFFSISGSDFVEMFVGVGASRIRDMFEQAKKSAPCIIFIDEIDAVGRHRGAGIGGGHDEREQTLNQLLVEMDGFDTNEGVIIIAATNRPDVLDKALLRPGRFDRRVVINLPDIKGRFEILKVHARKIKLGSNVDLLQTARGTPGASGADLENILNEAALIAARKNKKMIEMEDVNHARDKVLFGKERRSLEIDEEEKRTTAYHESGHTVVGMVVENADPVDKVTIIPRGFSLGSTMFLPKKNRLSYWKRELVDQLAVLMGGRCAEEVFVKDVSSGARKDLEQATHIARSMVCEWGMSQKLGLVAYDEPNDSGQYLGLAGHHEKRYSEETARSIDEEVRQILDEAYIRAKKIINDRFDQVELMTRLLMELETLDRKDIEKVLSNEWSEKDTLDRKEQMKRAKVQNSREKNTPPPPPQNEVRPRGDEEVPPPILTHDASL